MVKAMVTAACAVLLAVSVTGTASIHAAGSQSGTSADDPELAQIQVVDNVGAALANAHIRVEERPTSA